jgi:DNA repair exonuclease SbcCD nuclease subunit
LEWSLNYADQNRLLPILLGDLFDRPRDNANWLVGELLALLANRTVLAIHGNHDCRENQLTDDDTFSIILKSDHLTLLSPDNIWSGLVNGRPVTIGGSSWGQDVPESFSVTDSEKQNPLVLWVTHHDISWGDFTKPVKVREVKARDAAHQNTVSKAKEQPLFDTGESERADARESHRSSRGITPSERPGIDLIVNGHIHTRHEMQETGTTSWVMPGNLVRLGRSKTSRIQPPSIMELTVEEDSWKTSLVEVPHEPFDDVFLETSAAEPDDDLESSFVKGLAELQARRTESGAGLVYFLEHNLNQFDRGVAQEVVRLAEKVTKQSIDLDWSKFETPTHDEQETELTGLLAGIETDDAAENIESEISEENESADEAVLDESVESDENLRQKMLF